MSKKINVSDFHPTGDTTKKKYISFYVWAAKTHHDVYFDDITIACAVYQIAHCKPNSLEVQYIKNARSSVRKVLRRDFQMDIVRDPSGVLGTRCTFSSKDIVETAHVTAKHRMDRAARNLQEVGDMVDVNKLPDGPLRTGFLKDRSDLKLIRGQSIFDRLLNGKKK